MKQNTEFLWVKPKHKMIALGGQTLYEHFLKLFVTPNLTKNAYVKIHIHTDINENHNHELSTERTSDIPFILEEYLKDKPNLHVKLETLGFGE